MAKVIFELEDVRMSPNSEPKLNININFESMKRSYSKAQELADRIIDTIDAYRIEQNGTQKIKEVKKYNAPQGKG